MSDAQAGPDRFELLLVLGLYVLPLGATVVVLAVVGLPGLALALLAVEAGVSAAVLVAKRPEGGARRWSGLAAVLAAVAVAAGLAALVVLAGA